MTLYRLDQVKKVFGNRTVLSIDNLEIQQGLIYSLLGPNGSGKTTLINILGFLDAPTSGNIYFDGNRVNFAKNGLRQFRRNVVVVSQRPVMFTTSVFKNMEFGLKIRKIPVQQRHRIIEESLELVGMHHLIKAPAVNLSGGETQRVVLARALALSPRIIICDEPTSSVDLENQIAVMNLLRRINREKEITIIISSHDRLQTTKLAHHNLFLDQGQLFDAAYENMFGIHLISREENHAVYSLNGSVRIRSDRDLGQRKRVLIDPWKIVLLPGENSSAPGDLLKGEITQILREKDTIRLVLDSSIELVLMMTVDDYKARKPTIGDIVNVHIPDEAIRII